MPDQPAAGDAAAFREPRVAGAHGLCRATVARCPIETGADPQLAPFIEKGRALYLQRQGQLNLGCTNCHDDNWDKRLAGSAITQGHPTGYPLYRLEWQSLGSLQRRLRACITGIRAQAYDYGAPELVELELYVMSRARGMADGSAGGAALGISD